MLFIITGVIVVFYILLNYVWSPLFYWKIRGIAQVPAFPIVGNYYSFCIGKKSFGDCVLDLYSKSKIKVFGSFVFTQPSLFVRDVELLQDICVKQFDCFTDHVPTLIPEDCEPLWEKNLFALRGTKWKNMRTTLSPSFTGTKLRGMTNLLNECADQLTQFYLAKCKDGENVNVELKEMYTRYTNDIIATTAFGIKCDSFKDPDNVFYTMGQEIGKMSIWRMFVLTMFPSLWKVLKMKLFSEKIYKYFFGVVKDTIETREKNNIVRHDMIHLLLEARKGHGNQVDKKDTLNDDRSRKLNLTDLDITAQAFIFFLAGFETVSTAMCFGSYELALNIEIQKRLQKEIDETFIACNGEITYDVLNKMKYMDMVVSETLRKWPSNVQTNRVCTQSCTLRLSNNEKINVDEGLGITIPIFALHRDPELFQDPDKFNPERFSEDNKHAIVPFSYLPFGFGPRTCIGNRFALLEIKMILFHMLKNFDFLVTKQTEIPLELKPKTFALIAKNGYWIALKPR